MPTPTALPASSLVSAKPARLRRSSLFSERTQRRLPRKGAASNQRSARTIEDAHYIPYFFGGTFLANAVPHFVNGISGRPFQSPFAKRSGEGLSSSTVNVLWGFFNLVIGYLLIRRVGDFDLRPIPHVAAAGNEALLLSVMMARHFGRFHGGNSTPL